MAESQLPAHTDRHAQRTAAHNKDQEVLDAVAARWHDVWKSCKQEPVEPKIAVVLSTKRCTAGPARRISWKLGSRLVAQLVPTTGSSQICECFPPNWRSCLLALQGTWEVAGCTPRALKYSRQVNLVKPRKMQDGSIKSSDLRPINVFLLWYLWWSGAWAKIKSGR